MLLTKNKVKKKKEITQFRIRLRTKNHSAEDLRDKLYSIFNNRPTVVRLGSLTPIEGITSRANVLEINKTEAIEISRNKREMKEAFTQNQVKTANWYYAWGPKFKVEVDNNIPHTIHFMNSTINKNGETVIKPSLINELHYPILSKSLFGQGGVGNTMHKTQKSLEDWMKGKDLSNYIFEEYYNYAREYRLHVTQDECFLSWRKLRKKDSKDRWYFNSNNCVWIGEDNPLFDKPINWEEIKQESIKACKAVGLDICAIDVRIQSAHDEDGNERKTCDYIILETNSAASLGIKGTEAYYNQILKIINK